MRKTIRNYKRMLKHMFSDPFIVKADHTNIVVTKIQTLRTRLENRLWRN